MRLLITSDRRELLDVWSRAFADVDRVVVMQTPGSRPAADAELVPSVLVHDRYGGRAELYVSRVLPSREGPEAPAWIVTTPPMPARVVRHGRSRLHVVSGSGLTPAEEAELLFGTVFDAIIRFNHERGATPAIASLHIDLDVNNAPQGEPAAEAEAEAARRAYLARFGGAADVR